MWHEPKFDTNQFANKSTKAVSADFRGGDDWESTGISFGDLNGMHIKRTVVKQIRRLETPDWAVNDAKLRQVVLMFAERRLYIRDHSGTDKERLQKIAIASEKQAADKKAKLEKMLAEYNQYSEHGKDKDHDILSEMAVQIQVIDTDICILQRGVVAVASAVVYAFHRRGLNSVEVAELFDIKAPMCRVWDYRMRTIGAKLFGGLPRKNSTNKTKVVLGKRSSVRLWNKDRVMALFAMMSTGASRKDCARILGITPYTVLVAWSYWFPGLRMPQPHHGKPGRLRVPKTGPSQLQARRVERVRRLFLLRTSGHSFAKCAVALGLKSGTSVQKLWRRHFGDLELKKPEPVAKVKKTQPQPPTGPVVQVPPKRGRTRWTPETIEQLGILREQGNTFAAIAKLMGLARPQAAQSAWSRYCKR